MLRKVYNGQRFLALMCVLTALFTLGWYFIPAGFLIIFCNGVFFGSLITITTVYGAVLSRTFLGQGEYDRQFHYGFSIMLQWVVILLSRGISVWYRIIDVPSMYNDNFASALVAFLTFVTIIWQAFVITENEKHDRHVLIWTSLFGGLVAIVLIVLQAYGMGWINIKLTD